ncbi:HAD family hydrolase [Embleya sp. NPDC020630]|uniref:HAD family hydrolase n=1 Tax=Embleya sp. NPDC020630 TaxID=3363979 RepID=UPI00379E0E35
MEDVDLRGVEAMLVDWDGTVVDSQPTNFRALREVLASVAGVVLDEGWYRARLGTSVDGLLAELGISVHTDDVLERCGAVLVERAHLLRTFPEVVALVRRARGLGLPCAVASGGGGLVVRAGIAAVGLGELFDEVVVREDVGRGKPAPDLFLEAARRLAIHPAGCLVVEDADEGVAAARAAGMRVLDVRGRVTSRW